MKNRIAFLMILFAFTGGSMLVAFDSKNTDVAAKKPKSNVINKKNAKTKGPEFIFKDFEHEFVDKKGNYWTLKSKQASIFKHKKRALLENIQIRFTDNSQGQFVLASNKATVIFSGDMEGIDRIDLAGDINVYFPDNSRLKTKTLTYSYAKERLETQDFVILEGEKIDLHGIGMIVTLKNNNIVLTQKKAITIIKGTKQSGLRTQ